MLRIGSYETSPVLSFAEVLANGVCVVPCRMGTWGTSYFSGKGEKPEKQGRQSHPRDFQQEYSALLPVTFWEPVKVSEEICLVEHPLLVSVTLVSLLIGSR